MAKRKKRRRTSLITKGINIGVTLLAFSRILTLGLAGNVNQIVREATFGLADPRFAGAGTFKIEEGLPLYGPMLAAFVLKKAISMVRRTARF